MYGLNPEPLYAHEDLFKMAGAAQRIHRIEQALGTQAISYRDEDVPTLFGASIRPRVVRIGALIVGWGKSSRPWRTWRSLSTTWTG